MGSPRRESTRESVKRAASEVFLAKGFADASIQDIADLLQMPRASVSYHIPSKEELFFEIFYDAQYALNQRLDTIVGYPLSVTDRLRLVLLDLLRSSVQGTASELAVVLAVNMVRDIRFMTPEHQTTYIGLRRNYTDTFISLLEEGVAKGDFRPLGNTKIVAFGIIGMTGNFERWFRPTGSLSMEEINELFMSMLLSGIAARPGD
jgi:AcrR family transcriptional regulator